MELDQLKAKIVPVLEANGVEYAAVFGSAARGEDRPDSDVDLLVRFKPEVYRNFSLLDHIRFANNLGDLLGKKVDLITEHTLKEFVVPNVKKDLIVLYGKGQRSGLL